MGVVEEVPRPRVGFLGHLGRQQSSRGAESVAEGVCLRSPETLLGFLESTPDARGEEVRPFGRED
jgi:hypothetical protein